MPQDSNGAEPNVTWFDTDESELLEEDFELEDLEFDMPTAEYEQALEGIQADAITPFDLTGFSDITRKQMHEVRSVWSSLPTEKRQTLADLALMVSGEYLYTDFGRFFEVLLGDEDAKVRQVAATGVHDTIVDTVIKPLVEMAEHDPSEEVREAALQSLASFTIAMDMGNEIDDKDVQRLMKLKDWAQDESWPSRLRAAALASWAAFTGDEETGKIIEKFAMSDDDALQLGATRAMAAWGPGKLVPFLERQLQSKDVEHREAAARALGTADDASVVPMLTMLAREDKEPAVREAAYIGLSEQGSKQAVQALQELRKHAADDDLDVLDASILHAQDMAELEDLTMFEFDDEQDEE